MKRWLGLIALLLGSIFLLRGKDCLKCQSDLQLPYDPCIYGAACFQYSGGSHFHVAFRVVAHRSDASYNTRTATQHSRLLFPLVTDGMQCNAPFGAGPPFVSFRITEYARYRVRSSFSAPPASLYPFDPVYSGIANQRRVAGGSRGQGDLRFIPTSVS